MKTILTTIARQEGGKILIMALVLLLVGVLLLTPLLGLMSTGLTAGQVYEKKMAALYACDAGIDDAIWRLVYTFEGLPDDPYSLAGQINHMHVTVEKIDEIPEDDGVIVYIVKSTATRDGKTAGEVLAELRWQPLPLVEGSSPGIWAVEPPYVDVLATINPHTIAFGMQLGQGKTSEFHAAGDEEPVNFGKNDLLGLDLAARHAWIYFESGDYGIKQGDTIGDVHHHTDKDGYECLLMSLKSPNTTVGKNSLSINPQQQRDIVRVHIDPSDPKHGTAKFFLRNIGRHFACNDKVEIEALGMLDLGDQRIEESAGDMLVALARSASLEHPHSGSFQPYEVIRLDLGDPADPDYPQLTSFHLYLDTWTHILARIDGNKAAPRIVSLAPLPEWTWGGERHPDGRLLVTFNKEVIGSDDRPIQLGDIAIWTPEGWTYDENEDGEFVITDYGLPYSEEHPGEITLHIDMSGSDVFVRIFIDLDIISWNVAA